jgi:hypothetical protein
MGQRFSNSLKPASNPVNYNCPVCKSTGKLPNIAGRFFIINDTECQCNGCDSVFEKKRFYETAKPQKLVDVNVINGC